MTVLLMITRIVLLISVVLYLYFFFRRKQQKNVVIKMWLIIIVGLLAAVIGRLIEVNLGTSDWGSIQFSIYLSLAILSYSVWKLSAELKKRR